MAKDCTNTPGLPSIPSIQELSIMNKIRRNTPFSKFDGNLKKNKVTIIDNSVNSD